MFGKMLVADANLAWADEPNRALTSLRVISQEGLEVKFGDRSARSVGRSGNHNAAMPRRCTMALGGNDYHHDYQTIAQLSSLGNVRPSDGEDCSRTADKGA
jgi:hypothetical protein